MLDVQIFHALRKIAKARDLVVGERGIDHLSGVEVHLLEEGKAKLHDCPARDLRRNDRRVDRLAGVHHVHQLRDLDVPGFRIDLHLGARPGNNPERRHGRALPGLARGRHVVGPKRAAPDDIAGLHPVALAEQLRDRRIRALDLADISPQCCNLVAHILGRELDRVPHMEQRTRAERPHVVWGCIGIGVYDLDRFSRNVERLTDHLRERGVGALAHVDGAAIERDRAVGRNVDDRNRRRGRRYGLDRNPEAASAPQRAATAVERTAPSDLVEDRAQHLIERRIDDRLPGRMHPAFAQEIFATELGRVELERPRHDVHLALVGPCDLRQPESAQRAGRGHVGIERVGIDPHIVDVVRTGGSQPGLLRHPRPDVGIGTAVPEHLAFARDDPAVLVDPALDAERARVLGDLIEHLFHGSGDLHRLARDHGQCDRECLELDVELRAIAAAEIGYFDPHLVFRPAEQSCDLDAHE